MNVVFLSGISFLELMILSSSGWMGMPPGERDANFLRAVPEDVALYVEWAARSAGTPGAAGIDGLAADPEVRARIEEQAREAGRLEG